MILETVSGEISFAAVETSVVDFVKVDAFHVVLQDVLPFTNLHQTNNFKKVPGALWGWEVKILVGNLVECRTILISVHSNQ